MAVDFVLLASILDDCAWETIATDKIATLASQIQLDDVDDLFSVVENLDLADLEYDAGDIGDEYWRVSSSVARTLVTLGPAVIPRLEKHRKSQHTYVKMTVAMVEEALVNPTYFS